MLHQLDDLDAVRVRYDDFRRRFAIEVDKIVVELGKKTRRNAQLIESTCALIEGHCRDYQTFLQQVNALRVRQESDCKNRDELLAIRHVWGEASARTSLFQNEVNRWRDYKALVHLQIKPKRLKLYMPDAKLPKIHRSQTQASDDVFKWIHAMMNPQSQSDAARNHGCSPDIGLPNSDFHQHLHAAFRVLLAQDKSAPIRFLDVGCGVGLKVYAALRYFDEAEGFDFDHGYIEMAQRFLSLDKQAKAEVFQHDALTYDGYDAFDVIYVYRPSNDSAVLTEIEKRIVETARPGTIVIAPHQMFTSRFEELGCGRVDGCVFLSDTTAKQADAWRRKAELMGEFIQKSDDSLPRSIWSPISEVSHRNGYDLP